MSPFESILGLPGLAIQRVERHKDIHIWARPAQRAACIHCQHQEVRIKATHRRTLKHTRQGNRIMVLHLRVPKYHCPQCNRYFRHRFSGILPRLRATEAYRLEVFEAHEGGVSQRKLSRTHRIGSATVERWYQSFVKQRVRELSGRPCPQVLGIDEHFFTRKRGYATTLVDLKNHKVFDVVLGRSEASLRSYLKRLPGKENVRVIVMDLSETYRRIARQYFPNAQIVADRFHVVRLVNQHFLKLWQQYDPEGRKNRGLLSLMRRHHWRLSAIQKERLHQYLAHEPVLQALYFAKQQLNGFLVLKTLKRKRAENMLPKFLRLIEQFELSGRPCPQVLGIDEHFFTRKRGYATTLVDLKNHKVFDVVLGRSEASLRSYLKRLPGKENVRVIVMDLSETYRRIARQYFPNAQIVADRFHVVRLVNQHFLKLWQQYDPEGRKNRGLLSLMRRHHWRLSAIQKERLHQYLAHEPVLQALYFAKQQLNGFLVLKTLKRKRAENMLPKFLRLIEQFEQSPARALATTLRSWLEPIVRMWRFSKTNGITEGFHTKMEMLSRRAYGFRNFENYRLRVLAQCGWDGVINRV